MFSTFLNLFPRKAKKDISYLDVSYLRQDPTTQTLILLQQRNKIHQKCQACREEH